MQPGEGFFFPSFSNLRLWDAVHSCKTSWNIQFLVATFLKLSTLAGIHTVYRSEMGGKAESLSMTARQHEQAPSLPVCNSKPRRIQWISDRLRLKRGSLLLFRLIHINICNQFHQWGVQTARLVAQSEATSYCLCSDLDPLRSHAVYVNSFNLDLHFVLTWL